MGLRPKRRGLGFGRIQNPNGLRSWTYPALMVSNGASHRYVCARTKRSYRDYTGKEWRMVGRWYAAGPVLGFS